MTIIYKNGDCLKGDEKYVIHGCNAKGVMGSGIAKQIKEDFPKAFDDYFNHHKKHGLHLGEVIPSENDSKTIFNAITQQNYGRDVGKRYVSYDAIRDGLKWINGYLSEMDDMPEVAMPQIGAGLGGGDWDTIATIIEEECTSFIPIVYIYE